MPRNIFRNMLGWNAAEERAEANMFRMFTDRMNEMAHTIDEILAEQDTMKTEIANLKIFVQALKDKIGGIPADVQTKIDEAFANETASVQSITDIMNQSSAQL